VSRQELSTVCHAGGPSFQWPVQNHTSPQQFALWVLSTGRGLNNTVELTELCQQNVQVTDATGNVIFAQPPPSANQPGSCM
jgi:hypothetical protein